MRPDGLPDIGWCSIPGGEVVLKHTKKQKYRRTLSGRFLHFDVKPFYIAKFPITYGQYCTFLAAEDGFRQYRWWDGLAERQSEPGEQRFKFANYPVVYVSWHDAIAFCRWLSEKLGYEIRLPTEWEWQQAASHGNPANEYPWGAIWDSAYTNTLESDLNQPTAVGLYPLGATAGGVLDMSGNVWEWCLNADNSSKSIELGVPKFAQFVAGRGAMIRAMRVSLPDTVSVLILGSMTWVFGS